MTKILVLGSSSRYRGELLTKICPHFTQISPDIDESAQSDETAEHLVARLAREKNQAVINKLADQKRPPSVIITSDQVAVLNGEILCKPGDHSTAVKQLSQCSGRPVEFLTSLCVSDQEYNQSREAIVPYTVSFRELSQSEITHYLEIDRPYDCAGSFKAEGLGITLFESMSGADPNALIGLPLIKVAQFLRELGHAHFIY